MAVGGVELKSPKLRKKWKKGNEMLGKWKGER